METRDTRNGGGEPPQEKSRPSFRRLTYYSVLTGLCPLVPVPFLDDHLLRRFRRRMVRELAAKHCVVLSEEQTRLFVGEEDNDRRGCCSSVVVWGFLKLSLVLVRKIFRKVVVVLALKESVDTASRTFHEGYLLNVALSQLSDPPDRENAARIKGAVRAVCREVDTRPINQIFRKAFRGSFWLLRKGARILTRSQRSGGPDAELPLDEEEGLLSGFLDQLATTISEQTHYLRGLEQRLVEQLREKSPECANE